MRNRVNVRAIYPVCCCEFQEQEVPQEPFVALTSEEEDEVECAFSSNRYVLMIWFICWEGECNLYCSSLSTCLCRRRILVTHENSNIVITGEKFQCLRPTGWLNDEVNLFADYLFIPLLLSC